MIRTWMILLTVASILTGAQASLADQPAAKDPLGNNAALAYWQAFTLLPKLDEKQTEALKDAVGCRKPVDQSLVKAIGRSREALRQFRRGASISQCVWGLDVDAGLEAPLPHASQARQMASIACLRAAWHIEQRRNGLAIDDLSATMVFARHIGADGLIISLLVEYSVESMAITMAAANLPKFEPGDLDRLNECIDGLPEGKTMSYAMQMEKQLLLEWFIRELAEPGGKKRIFDIFANDSDNPEIKVLKKLSAEELRQAAINLRPLYDEFVELMTLSPDEVEKTAKRYEKDPPVEGASKHFAGLLLPAVVPARRSEAAHETRLKMLQAAIAVVKDGQAALEREGLADPYGDGPYEYAKLGDGFQLKSKLIDRQGKPVTLTVGQPPEK